MSISPIIVKGEDVESDWCGCANAHNLRRWHIDCRPQEKARSYFMGLSCQIIQRRTDLHDCADETERKKGRHGRKTEPVVWGRGLTARMNCPSLMDLIIMLLHACNEFRPDITVIGQVSLATGGQSLSFQLSGQFRDILGNSCLCQRPLLLLSMFLQEFLSRRWIHEQYVLMELLAALQFIY